MTKPKQPAYSASPKRELPTDPDALLTKEEIAQMLGVTRRWVQRAVALRYFPTVRVGKLVRARRADVLAFVEQRSIPARKETK